MNERGFSLLVVLLVLVVLAVAGTSAVTIANGEAGTAGARSTRAQALAAAEAGLAHFKRTASPTYMDTGWYLGADDAWFWLPETKLPGGELVQARYRVRGDGTGPIPASGRAIVEGQVLQGGAVVGQAALSVVLRSDMSFGDAGTNQEDLNQTGSSADVPGASAEPVSLMGTER